MFHVHALARTALFAGVLAAASLVTATAEAAPPPLQFSSNIHCAALTDVVTVINNTASDVVASVVLETSLQHSTKSATVPANGYVNLVFDLTIGERLDKVILRDANDVTVFTAFTDRVVTGTGECTRPAFDLVELTGYSLTCSGGTTHASVTVKNSGDYGHDLTASADAWFPTDSEYQAALQAGTISGDSETVALTAGSTRVIALDFEIVDAFLLSVTAGQTNVFTDGPRTPAAGESCAAAPVVTEAPQDTAPPTTVTGDTVPGDTVPGDTVPGDTIPNDTVPAGGPITPETGSDAPTTSSTSSTLPAAASLAAGGALPITGRSSLPVGLFGAVMFSIGLGLVRSARRHA